MKQNVYQRIRCLSALALAAGSFAAVASAQDFDINNLPDPDRPIFAVLRNPRPDLAPASTLPGWNSSFVYNGSTYNFTMVGTNPASSNVTTTIPTVIIPVKIVITSRIGRKSTWDPLTVPSNTGGLTAVENTVQSPMFDSTTTYIQGGTNVGTTQYNDAYQRANFWGSVQTNTGYHLILSPTVLSEVTLSPPSNKGKTGSPFGETVAEVDINWIDGQFKTIIANLGLQPSQLPIFMTYKTYLTQAGCCIGGYHTANGAQTYMHFSYIDKPGNFSQDVSALSHEVGEWTDDPFVNNSTACGILEVGDPIETEANFGGFPYVLHGFTFNLQDLVTLPYFGAPPATSVNNFFSFQGQTFAVCQNGA
jgi:hypothetical protein